MVNPKPIIPILVCVAVLPEPALGGLPKWASRGVCSPDHQLILDTISDLPIEEELSLEDDLIRKDEIRDIRARFPRGGLYRNDGSTKPLWPSDYQWYGKPIIAPDGEHVIFVGSWTYDEDGYESRAVEFTRKGKVLRSYSDTDVIPHWRLKAILNGLSPPTCAGTSFDAAQMTYTIRTNQGEEFLFDVTTGDLIAVYSPFRVYYALTACSVIAAIVLPIRRWWKRNQLQNCDRNSVAS